MLSLRPPINMNATSRLTTSPSVAVFNMSDPSIATGTNQRSTASFSTRTAITAKPMPLTKAASTSARR